MNLTNILLRDRSKKQKNVYGMSPFIYSSLKDKNKLSFIDAYIDVKTVSKSQDDGYLWDGREWHHREEVYGGSWG